MSYDMVRDHSGTCRKCGSVDTISRHPGKFPHCYRCGTYQLWMGKMREAPCVDGGGSTESHGQYVAGFGFGTLSRCAFCHRLLNEPLPEWPELDEEDLLIKTWPGKVVVSIRHLPTGVEVWGVGDGSLLKNKAQALRDLREKLKPIGMGAYNPDEVV